ncbi:MAG: hypothetical protein QXT25_04465 [Candidatus Anstonellaceae archaeon]
MKEAFFVLAFAALLAADISTYLYPYENASSISYITFNSSFGTAKIATVAGQEILLLLNEDVVSDKEKIKSIISEYYTKTFYPSNSELERLYGLFSSFNSSRNSKDKLFGRPAEQTCIKEGIMLAHYPCSTQSECMMTATMLCTRMGELCDPRILAEPILNYSKAIQKLNQGEKEFLSAYSSFSPANFSSSVQAMQNALALMKSGADEVSKSILRFPENLSSCRDCLGLCPEPRFDFISFSEAQKMLEQMKKNAASFAKLESTAEKLASSTERRLAYKKGEEEVKIFEPKFRQAKSRFEGIAAWAVETKKLVADSDFVSAANEFLGIEEKLSQKIQLRNFTDFEKLLSSYSLAGNKLVSLVNNSTTAYQKARDAQDNASDLVILAQWRTNRLSSQSVQEYNILAQKKNQLDAKFTPPMTSQQYEALAAEYQKLSEDAKRYIDKSYSFQDSIFGAGSQMGHAMVEGTMDAISGIVPISFKTRQSIAKYAPLAIIVMIDFALLLLGIAMFVYAFYHFHRFFVSKVAISGWVLIFIGFLVVLVLGSVGLYSIIVNSDRAVSFEDFKRVLAGSKEVAIVTNEQGVPAEAVEAMRKCALQIQAELEAQNKTARKYFVSSTCTVSEGNKTRQEKDCLEHLPDIPIFDLHYSAENQPPSFTVVVAKSAIFKGNKEYYSKLPCDPANVLG